MRKTIAAIVVTGVYLLTNLLSVEAAGPVETYQSWSDELKSYTQSVCDEYNVDYSLALGVIYNESRFQSGLTHVNSNGTVDYGLMQVNEVNFDYLNCWMIERASDVVFSCWHITNSTPATILRHFFATRSGQGGTNST